ncbi:hypothetical protein ACIQPP_05385 [Streptomyces violaceusniger]|uniref:hypothetical protein n=1 Tax=Streptomyces violaceusniger TaxID=68280 RepID=UPI001F23587A|nr:hypothetical protein [Streptomyces hygroscopicus]
MGYEDGLPNVVKLLKTPTAQLAVNGGSQHPDKRKQGGHGPTLADEVEFLMPDGAGARLLPTPKATDGSKGGPNQRGSKGDLTLPSAAARLLPTPTAGDSRNSRNATANRSVGSRHHAGTTLSDAAKLLPTPTATPYGSNQSPSPGAAVRPSLDTLAPELLAQGPVFPLPMLPTPGATDKGSGDATADERTAAGHQVDLSHRITSISTGESTQRRSRGGKRRSADPPPGQLTIEVA